MGVGPKPEQFGTDESDVGKPFRPLVEDLIWLANQTRF